MKVWLVREPSDPYEPWDVMGVFSTLELAREYVKTHRLEHFPDSVDVEEWEVDNPAIQGVKTE